MPALLREKGAITAAQAAVTIVILLLAVAAGVYFYSTTAAPAKSTSLTSSTVTTPIHVTPSTFVYETAVTPSFFDPSVSFFSYDFNVLQNVYEPLLWWNGTCGTCVIPWLAQSYTGSADGKTWAFTLRKGISFADGEPLNSTALYFSINRLLIEDGSTPAGHGTEASFLLQQLLNTSLSSVFCACSITYDQNYVKAVLGQNFIQVTGPLTFTVHVIKPSSAFLFLFAGDLDTDAMAPTYVMQHDLELWNAASAGYKLPFPTLSGSLMQKIAQYFDDEVATCNAGITPGGCGTTYLDGSYQGSLAGTGPYTIASFDKTSNIIILKANPNYWGGPYQFSGGNRITPKIQTVEFKYVPDQTTREIDLQNAAKSGQAMAIDVTNTNLYDIVDRGAWLHNNTLVSIIPGVKVYGVFPLYSTLFDHFVTNVTNVLTGNYYKFQPFADKRLREAFADSVNMTQIRNTVDNKVDQVALNVNPPGLPPTGSYNLGVKPVYSYNPHKVQDLLLDAMMHPLSTFRFTNGTLAPRSFFNNTFGCRTLSSSGTCANPVPQTIQLYFGTGGTVDEAIENQIAGTINNVSSTYNMGLTAQVVPLPAGTELTEALAVPGHLYFYAFGWIDDYPWVLDFLGPMLAPGQTYTGPDGWNLRIQGDLFQQAVKANSNGNVTGLVAISNRMNGISNQEVEYLWTFWVVNYVTMTSNVQGFYFNSGLSTAAAGGVGPEYFATLY